MTKNEEKIALALTIKFDSSVGDNITIRDYLYELLLTLWLEGESFSGKRPFGDGGWEFELYMPLIATKLIKGKLDEDGYVEKVDIKAANKLIQDIIHFIFYEKEKPCLKN